VQNTKKTRARDRLLRAAVEVFGKRGYHPARVSDIVAKAGVAQGTFYLYFENKEAIFLHLVDDFFAGLLEETLGRSLATELKNRDELTAQFGEMWRAILDLCRREPVLTALVLRESYAVGPESRAKVEDRFAQVAGMIDGYLRALSEQGLIRSDLTGTAAWAILGLIERATHYALFVDPEADLNLLADEFLGLELHGLFGIPEPPGAKLNARKS
jgi:AcrR family transcriptional regulator